MDWARILAYITGTVDQELLLCNEYLVAENRILKAQLKTPLRLTDAERMTLAEIVHRVDLEFIIFAASCARAILSVNIPYLEIRSLMHNGHHEDTSILDLVYDPVRVEG
jgi:hypothetical protein